MMVDSLIGREGKVAIGAMIMFARGQGLCEVSGYAHAPA